MKGIPISFMKMDDPRSAIEIAKHGAVEAFKAEGEVLPACILEAHFDPQTNSHRRYIIGVSTIFMGDDANDAARVKDFFSIFIERMAIACKASALAFASEAWIGRNRDVMPVDDPDRKEGVFIISEVAGKDPEIHNAFIEEKDGTRQLGEWTTMNASRDTGRFLHLLRQPPKGTS